MLFKDTMMLLLKRTKASKTPLLKLRILLLRSKSSLDKIKALTITTNPQLRPSQEHRLCKTDLCTPDLLQDTLGV